MTKEKIQSLTKYAEEMKNKLEGEVPAKRAHAPVEYKAFLARELRLTLAKLDEAKLGDKK